MTPQPVYPFVAIVGQEKMKLALILNIINPTLSGVLIRGEKGTAKSTAVRALAHILPAIDVVRDCPFNLPEGDLDGVCRDCPRIDCRRTVLDGGRVPIVQQSIPVVELPVGASEDRVVGSLDMEHALKKGEKQVEPGILAAAHRSILYVDEVNLLDDHVVDLLLDSAAMGVNTIEREGVSFTHPARFTLVGTMNPEEGELRPQLLDRFGLCVHIEGIGDPESRVAVMERRAAFEEDPEGFSAQWKEFSRSLVERIERAVARYPRVAVARELFFEIASYCLDVGVDGHRGDILMLKTAKTLAAYHGRDRVEQEDIDTAAELALSHRIRRQPLQDLVVDVAGLRRRKQAENAV